MGGIWKPSGRKRYRIWYKDCHGQRQTAPGFRDKAASEAKLRQLETDEERKAAGLPVVNKGAVKQPLEELFRDYIADLKRLGRGYHHHRAQTGFLTRLAKWEGWTVLSHVNHPAMTKALVHLNEKGYATKSLNHYRKAWHCFMEWAVDNLYLQENPLARVKRSEGQDAPRKRRAPTMEEWLALQSKSPLRRSRLYCVAGLTGLRKSECRDLERRDVDLDSDPPQLRLRAESTKARRADVVPILPDALPVLKELCQGLNPTDRIFPHFPAQRTLMMDIIRAGITPGEDGRLVTFHSLRYFFCTLLARELPIQVVRLLMRHKDISTTCRVYMDLGLQDVNEELLKLPSLVPAHAPAHTCRETVTGKVMPQRT